VRFFFILKTESLVPRKCW